MKTLIFAVVAQALWLLLMMSAAESNPDHTTAGAYCAVWILGMPVVAVFSVIFGAMASHGGRR